MNLNPHIHPTGGWFFINPADGMKIEAEDLMQLVNLVGVYRQRVGQEVGNPWGEVIKQIGERCPHMRV